MSSEASTPQASGRTRDTRNPALIVLVVSWFAVAGVTPLQVGGEPILTISGQGTSGGDMYCRATSGEADINVLAADVPTDAGPQLHKANVSFTANCNPSTAKPSGIAQVTGCWNFLGM